MIISGSKLLVGYILVLSSQPPKKDFEIVFTFKKISTLDCANAKVSICLINQSIRQTKQHVFTLYHLEVYIHCHGLSPRHPAPLLAIPDSRAQKGPQNKNVWGN